MALYCWTIQAIFWHKKKKINIGRKNNKKKNEKNNKEKKSNFADETERIIKAAAKLIKNEINIFGGHY